MSVKGPFFLRGVEGPGAIKSHRDGQEDTLLITVGSRTAVKYSLEDLSVSVQYFCPSYLNLSSPVVWDPALKQYCCVLNDIKLITWDGEENHLEKLQKNNSVSLSDRVIDALTSRESCFLVFSNGSIQSVSYLVQQKRMPIEDGVLPPNSVIRQSKLVCRDGFWYVTHLYSDENVEKTFAQTFRITIDPDSQQTRLFTHSLHQLPNRAISAQIGEDLKSFFVDEEGALHLLRLDQKSELATQRVMKLRKHSVNANVHLCAVDQNHVAVLGDEVDEDGSIITIINVEHSVEVVSQRIKAVASCKDSSGITLTFEGGSRLLFKHGQRVASIIVEELPSHLDMLIGSQTSETLEISVEDSLGGLPAWEVVGSVSQPVRLYQILPELLVKHEVEKVSELVESFSDIPELLIVSIIEMYLSAPLEKFGTKKSSDEDREMHRNALLARAFNLPVTESLLVQHLRNVEFSTAKLILSSLFVLLDTTSDDTEFERVLVWISVVLNAHYCNFILSKDDSSREILAEALSIVAKLEESFRICGSSLHMMKMIAEKKFVRPAVPQKVYNIEIVDL